MKNTQERGGTMKRKIIFSILLVFILTIGFSQAGDVTILQMLFVSKKALPEFEEVSVLITKWDMEANMEKINRASAQMQLKLALYAVENSFDIGEVFRKIPPQSALVIIDEGLFDNNKMKLYILSKCKESEISVVTSSQDYFDSGALVGYVMNEQGKRSIMINLTHYAHLQPKFTEEFIQVAGIEKVIL